MKNPEIGVSYIKTKLRESNMLRLTVKALIGTPWSRPDILSTTDLEMQCLWSLWRTKMMLAQWVSDQKHICPTGIYLYITIYIYTIYTYNYQICIPHRAFQTKPMRIWLSHFTIQRVVHIGSDTWHTLQDDARWPPGFDRFLLIYMLIYLSELDGATHYK